MNKLILALALVGILAIAGCASSEPSSSETIEPSLPDTSLAPPPDIVADEMTDVEDDVDVYEDERIIVADAAMYRGTVRSVTDEGSTRTILLEQPVGVDFGAPLMTFIIDVDTRFSFDATTLENGTFLEVFYGRELDTIPDYNQEFGAIAINTYMEEAATNYNGEVVEINPNTDKPGFGYISMKDLDTGDIMDFNYGDESNIYLNIDELNAGDKLNIFHTGAVGMSMPAQGYIVEARYFYDVNEPPETAYEQTGEEAQPPTGANP